ncbi:hypothetical protein BCR44DRAFT_1440484 [Catenaria anguillulae PL171]|uniref:Uncharacterized protein n=1 Tax=Catenaria anguillulae PL171 TaxID=765915 RepID=A0A1Y2HCQ2_9FUNG|nr:hypothetical protein BCR44DRAFT_1440484 [Catenaria anguillulae PL171]
MVNMVAAYGIVKMMLPLRIGISVFFTPSLAKVLDRVVLPLRKKVRGVIRGK